MVTDSQRELLRLVELEYQQAGEFIRSVVATTATIRGWAVTTWLALLGFAIERESAELSLLAIPLAGLFWFLDSYHSWLYRDALRYARSLERISSSYYDFLSRGDVDDDLEADLAEELGAHRFGLYSNFRRFAWTHLRAARPRIILLWFYTALVVGAIAVAALADSGALEDEEDKPASLQPTVPEKPSGP